MVKNGIISLLMDMIFVSNLAVRSKRNDCERARFIKPYPAVEVKAK
jgi:hypothetical protein